ncbi:MAG: multiple antibiotic resistance protein [Thermococcaceae archaeon]|jgi:multiple antibiotic resistance protein|uniref:MarC family protein n=1 Tax=Thermococcus TaxID=2263 RepID=UPI0007495135|nr:MULTISPECIES: MarC family protein [Thermococcus]KUK00232.1 MAG: Small neutral amino acid transporter [Thermococcales archaeon 44_46]MDK2783502.1 multiple antibiotic resistance protein [Thermococcaceae archaeon]MCA6213109.1 NAAT family transporter [Thermococcus bergensis]MDK2853744.1 multiple antibiotic resistance protein [Thermococcaceae archaeon]MDK2983863.1 multiple antibiotic resistance protein [Thermococcaceae archaeon]
MLLFFKTFLYVFAALFAVMNPIGAVPVYLSIVQQCKSYEGRISLAKRTSVAVFMTLMTFALVGEWIFKFFGATIDAFAIAGGILLFRMALEMLSGHLSTIKITREEEEEAVTLSEIAIIPLAIPLISGPGSITTVMIYMAKNTSYLGKVAVLLAIVVASLSVYIVLMSAEKVQRKLGKVGIRLITRMMGLILASMAVQLVINGIKGAFGL